MPLGFQIALAAASGPLSYLIIDALRSMSARVNTLSKYQKRMLLITINSVLAALTVYFPGLAVPQDITGISAAAIQALIGSFLGHKIHVQVAAEAAAQQPPEPPSA